MIKRIIFVFVISCISIYAQLDPQIQKYRDEPKGDIQYRREGIMDGNLVRTLYYNNGEVGQWPHQPSGEWPKGSGHSYLDGVATLIATEITAPGNNQVVHPLETSYREWMDPQPPIGLVKWGLEPIPGYINPQSKKPALNTDPSTWPSYWSDALSLTPEWNGYWYGYFGRGVTNSDFETFFAMDDSKDEEFKRLPYSYYPLASDSMRGGLGLRVEIRGFQWSHVLAEDIIFWHYDIVNISDYDYPLSAFGFYTDCGVGGTNDSEDDNAAYDTRLDLAYAYDSNGLGVPDAWKTGYYGYAYLESPGNWSNGFDDDQDGMIDEKRDDGIDNDHDWVGYMDLNGNGKWDADQNEPLNNDVGYDGVGPFDPQYNGPDAGEGDGIPTNGEPNYDKTDKDESDQIGLTSVAIYKLGQGGTGGGWAKDDEAMWLKMSSATFDTSIQRSNISMVFASGLFPLKAGQRERFSMALVFGENLEDIIFNKETVQQIYNANYNFSKPPYKPKLTAIPGDGKVLLYWDKIAEQSRDPFLGYQDNDPTKGYKKDFEGYLVYRSTEAEFTDIKIITDSKGSPIYWKPIAQFDLIDSIKGPDPVGINGARFWRGSNTGLQNAYIDEDVQNGQRYYYALVSYDMGDPNKGTAGLQPSECTKIISEDFSGNIQFIDINCAVVTPNAPAAGYVAPQIVGDVSRVSEGLGTGSLNVMVFNPSLIQSNASYQISFTSVADSFPSYHTQSYSIIRTKDGVVDTLERNLDSTFMGAEKFSPPFDGMTLSVVNNPKITVDTSGWLVGTSNLRIDVNANAAQDQITKMLPWPADYELTWYDQIVDTTIYTKIPINVKAKNLTTGQDVEISLRDFDRSASLTMGDTIQIIEFVGPQSVANYRVAWNISYRYPLFGDAELPKGGDKYFIRTNKPFKTDDKFVFSTKSVSLDKDLAKTQLNKINVVPNPYLGAATWERKNLNSTGRGDRKIDFINLPPQCTVRIYTMAGSLVKTLYKEDNLSDGTLSWDLITEDGMDIAYGIYIYHVDAPGIGEHIGKFAVIK
ncbi:MAG TPA: hypothetical protein VFF33_05585 [Ignavibacteriaceae bacterium]|nr:hypothetical protein [Ignavibacteriaceae bacterium]